MKDLKVLSLFISALMWRQLGDRKSPWENLFVVSSAVISPLVESDAVFTVPSANHWQLHNCCFSLLCFVLSICLLFKPNTPPPHTPLALTRHSCACSFTWIPFPRLDLLQWFWWTPLPSRENWTGRLILSTGWVKPTNRNGFISWTANSLLANSFIV